MKDLYRHYRQVEISSRNGEESEVQGYEEIWHNGHKQVRHWTDKEALNSLPIETFDSWDLWNDLWEGFNFSQLFTRRWQKFAKICQRLPSALQAAWRELNSVD
jgi:arylsulfatase A-like enzyme